MIPSSNTAPSVIYKKHTSDSMLMLVLSNISVALGRKVNVHSGDRELVPKGGAKHSLHLKHRAADLHVNGMRDQDVFAALMINAREVIKGLPSLYKFQIIHHGHYTQTEGEHIHVGHYALTKTMSSSSGIAFITEGITPQGKGKYAEVKFVKGDRLEV